MTVYEKYLALKDIINIGAIKISPKEKIFKFTSGISSPIYFDNRLTLSYDDIRRKITNGYLEIIIKNFIDVEVIAGVATGAISQGTLVADRLGLPFVYVRSGAKEHATKKLVEGKIKENQKVVVIEDLISTGGSSIKAVEALRDEGADVLGVIAAFSYDFKVSEDIFEKSQCKLYSLFNFEDLVFAVLEEKYIEESDVEILHNWRDDQKI